MTEVVLIQDAETLLAAEMRRSGVQFHRADPRVVWAAFKAFCEVPVACVDENVLFECGTFGSGHGRMFRFGFMRHFVLEAHSELEGGTYRYRENLIADVVLPPVVEVQGLTAELWLSDAGDLRAFVERVEVSPAFAAVTRLPMLGRLEIARGG